MVKRLKNLKLIDYRTAYELTTNNAICPRIYGQPKAHKQNLPLRPVIPNVTAPTYKLSKYIAGILQSSFHSPYNATSSFEFCDEVNRIKLPEGHIMISLDVTSLFTNVPRHLVIRNIIHRWNEVKTRINLDLFLEIVEFCMEASYFCFEGQFYKQTFGTAMGSPLSPIVADIVLDSVISEAMSSLPFGTTIFRKYVDDIFMTIPRNMEQQVLSAFNSIEPRLQFTIETEENNRLPFLDMTVIRNPDQTLTTEWYAKPIASGRMLNYKSFHQPKHKMNVANNFIHRVCSLTRNKPMEETAAIIRQHLQRNSYPKHLINRLLHLYTTKRNQDFQMQSNDQQQPTHQPISSSNCVQIQSQHPLNTPPSRPSCQQIPTPPTVHPSTINPIESTRSQPSRQPPTQPAIMPAAPIPHSHPEPLLRNPNDVETGHPTTNEPNSDDHNNGQSMAEEPATNNGKIYRSIPYIPALSHRIIKTLSKDYPNISVATKQLRTVDQLHTKVKFPVNKEEISNVIYSIPCNDCDSCYVGMTRNNLHKRLAGHRSNVNKLDRLMNDNHTNTETATAALIETTTALIQHCIEHDHRFDLNRTQIIDHSYKSSTLPFLEMCHITNTNHTVNKRTDIDRLSTTYAAVLHSIKNIDERNKTRREQQIDDERR